MGLFMDIKFLLPFAFGFDISFLQILQPNSYTTNTSFIKFFIC